MNSIYRHFSAISQFPINFICSSSLHLTEPLVLEEERIECLRLLSQLLQLFNGLLPSAAGGGTKRLLLGDWRFAQFARSSLQCLIVFALAPLKSAPQSQSQAGGGQTMASGATSRRKLAWERANERNKRYFLHIF
jgi:hypothetical protein